MNPTGRLRESVAPQTSFRALHALDNGRFAEAVELYGEGMTPAEGTEGALWRAEVALYLGRFEEAEDALGADRALAGSDPAPGLEHLTVRRNLLLAELAMEGGSYEEAHAAFTQLKDDAHECEDAFTEMRAWYDLARVAFRRSEHTNCLEYAAVAASLAEAIGNSFYQGCCVFNRAAALFEAGDIDASERAYAEALSILSSTENLRFRAFAEQGYAGVLVARDRIEEGLLLLQRAEATLTWLGNVRNIQIVRNATAWSYFALGHYDAAYERARALLDFDRGSGDSRAELYGLKLVACVELARDRVPEALQAASEAARLAAMTGSASDVLDARMLESRCLSRSGKVRAADRLRETVAEADACGTRHQSAVGRIYLADVLHASDPVAAAAALDDARERARQSPNAWVQAELRALERARMQWPIRIETDGSLIICLGNKLPSRADAHDALDKVLIRTALDRANGKYAAAGRLIGEKRWNLRHLAVQHNLDTSKQSGSAAPGLDRKGSLEERSHQ